MNDQSTVSEQWLCLKLIGYTEPNIVIGNVGPRYSCPDAKVVKVSFITTSRRLAEVFLTYKKRSWASVAKGVYAKDGTLKKYGLNIDFELIVLLLWLIKFQVILRSHL